VAKIFTDNNLKVKYFEENNKESGDSVVSGMQLKTDNTEIEDASFVAGWQPCVESSTSKSGLYEKSAWPRDLNGHLKDWC
jgi:hypothetical protein